MDGQIEHTRAKEARDLINYVRQKGVRLWAQEGQLRYSSPKGSLSPDEIDGLRRLKEAILARLKSDDGANDTRTGLIPLTFTQLVGWRALGLPTRPGRRQVAWATQLQGTLRIEDLDSAVSQVLQRHDALRMRIQISNGEPRQVIERPRTYRIDTRDCSHLVRHERLREVVRQIEAQVRAPTDPAQDPPFEITLYKCSPRDHILYIALDHMVSDAYSLELVVNEICAIYVARVSGVHSPLAPVRTQLSDHALWQSMQWRSFWPSHSGFWSRHLEGEATRFPKDADGDCRSWGAVPLRLQLASKERLLVLCREIRITLPVMMMAAYVAVVSKWCDSPDVWLRCQYSGRELPGLDTAVGYFACMLHMRIRLLEADSLSDVINRVREEYCTAYEHADLSYLETLEPRPSFTRTCSFNWVSTPLKASFAALEGSEHELRCEGVEFSNPPQVLLDWDFDPALVWVDGPEEISGAIYYPTARFSEQAMQRFADNLLQFIVQSPDAVNLPLNHILLQ